MRPASYGSGLAVLITLGMACGAQAGERFGRDGYARSHGYGTAYGFADDAIGGIYAGAPLIRFPRPSELVPPAWGYGTYGVPTVSGIRQAPTAAPTLTVIDAEGPATHGSGPGSRITGRGAAGFAMDDPRATARGDVRIVTVTVPRR